MKPRTRIIVSNTLSYTLITTGAFLCAGEIKEHNYWWALFWFLVAGMQCLNICPIPQPNTDTNDQ